MKRHPLIFFFVLMFAISWGIWLPLILVPKHYPFSPLNGQLMGAFGPGLAALIVTGLTEGVEGLRKLFSRLLVWRVSVLWYFIALLLPAVVSLLVTVLHMMIGGYAPDFTNPPIYHIELPKLLQNYNAWSLLAPVFLYQLLTSSTVSEELGWRGFALTRLQQRHSALDSSLFLAVVWTVWSLPLLYLCRPQSFLMTFLFMLCGAIPAQVLATWIFNSTGGSLLLAVFFNNAIKITDLFVAAPDAKPIIPVAAYWVVTLLVVSAVGTSHLTLRPVEKTAGGNDPQPQLPGTT